MQYTHKPYIKAYFFYGIVGCMVFFSLAIPIGSLIWLISRFFGDGRISFIFPLFRIFLSAIIGYFVFRYSVIKFILQDDVIPQQDSAGKNTAENSRGKIGGKIGVNQ